MGKVYKIISALLIILLIMGCNTPIPSYQEKIDETKEDVALAICNKVSELELKKVNTEFLSDINNLRIFVNNINSLIRVINNKLGNYYEISDIEADLSKVSSTIEIVTRYVPVIEAYNSLILSCENLDISNEETVNQVIINSSWLGLEVFMVQTKLTKQVDFTLVKFVIGELRLDKIKKYCPNCYEVVKNQLEIKIREIINQEKDKILGK